jgi:hypothetical protein
MPNCKNDPTKYFKGTEKSPKGLGWCAHSEKLGIIRKGKDGNRWIIKKIKNGSKRWIKFNMYKPINLIKNTQKVFKQDKKIYNDIFSNEMYNLIPKYVKKYGCKDRTPGEIVMMILERSFVTILV